ncbi:uncharacterized protein KY384_004982 [Bacidia gigantensis]|uniref:uncharacterized protein n=1 Tax=Bacidia gigantensis TaxID=2732470 RepID=UPI001D03BFE4|nr:uncharacterized protein KY384_004982 [Bacidia gigantensis]KAG8530479.1 hypothetical protein KY384_004982 [Bacidia gigantensis]
MGIGDFQTICSKNLLPVCSLIGPPSPITGGPTGIQPSCYARSVEFANTVIFEAATDFAHILALGMAVIMVLHVRSKFTAVGRKEIATFFYLYMALTMTSLILDSGVSPPGSASFPYLVAIQNGFTSALCTCLFINGFVGFQLYEDGTRQSVWLIRGCSVVMFIVSGAVSIFTFKGKAGLGPQKTVGLFVVLYLLNGIALLVYVVSQVILVANTLQDRWPLGDIAFGVFFFVVGQVILYVFSDTICAGVQHYLDGLFFATMCNLLAVMMVYKYWDSITKEDLEFSVGTKQGNWEVKELLTEDDRRGTVYHDNNSEKRKGEGEEDYGEDDEDIAAENLSRRKSMRRQTSALEDAYPMTHQSRHSLTSNSISSPSTLDPYGQTQNGPYRMQAYDQSHRSPEFETSQEQEVVNPAAGTLLQEPINQSSDAFSLLIQASNRIQPYQDSDAHAKIKSEQHNTQQIDSERQLPYGPATIEADSQYGVRNDLSNLDPAITGHGNEASTSTRKALSIWSRLRFVRAGWFTAKEAMAYVNYYYHFLAPLTPVTHPDLSNVDAHPELLSEEPMLTVTILTIASRYMKVQGPGSQTRSLMIHERLWHYLQDMTTRMFWAQEQFGGGFCGAGASGESSSSAERGKLRTLGSIESLLLLSDFHPRSMHFPPNDDDEDVLAPDEAKLKGLWSVENDTEARGSESTFAGWTEPAVRSDRMSWSLIGFAHALAYELGLFGTYVDGDISVKGQVKRQGGSHLDHKRADRIERLLFIYVTQACGRFGFPSIYPDHLTNQNVGKVRNEFLTEVSHIHQNTEDLIQEHFVEVMSLNKYCNDLLFPSKQHTAHLIHTGEYHKHLNELKPIFDQWHIRLNQSKVPKYAKILLSIEVQYFRTFANGLALQAKIEQYVAGKATGDSHIAGPQSPESSTSSDFSNFSTQNERYIREVIEASRQVLLHVVDDLLPNDNLKHVPVRAYFRIVSAAMFLLKTFAAGARRAEIDASLGLLDRTVRALRTSVVDDVHLCLRIADLLEKLTTNIRRQFIRWRPEHASNQPSVNTNQAVFLTHHKAGPSERQQPIRFVRQTPQQTHVNNSPGPAYLGAPDPNLTVIPPPRGIYNQNPMSYLSSPAATYASSQQSPYTMQQPSQPHQSHHRQQSQQSPTFPNPMSANASPEVPNFNFAPDDDWLNLNLQPLIDNNGGDVSMGQNDNWYGNPFGPETHNNLEVLDKLMNNGWPDQQEQGGSGWSDQQGQDGPGTV